jgi:hypothetical protein
MGVREREKMGWDGRKKENGVVSLDKENNTELFSDVSSNSPRTVTLQSLLYVVYVAVLVRLPSAL